MRAIIRFVLVLVVVQPLDVQLRIACASPT